MRLSISGARHTYPNANVLLFRYLDLATVFLESRNVSASSLQNMTIAALQYDVESSGTAARSIVVRQNY